MPVRPSGSFLSFLVPGLAPSPDDERFFARLREHRCRAIDDQPVAEPAVGWVVPGTFASSDFRPDTVFCGPHVLLRARIDVKKLPANALRVRLAEALDQLGGKIARSAKARLKDDLEKELLARIVPSTALVDALWRPRDETLLVASGAGPAAESFLRLFRATFGASPHAATPGPLAGRVAAPELTIERLGRLAPLAAALPALPALPEDA